MILRGHLDDSGALVHDRVVDAVMAELELGARAAEGQSQQLMPEADPEGRDGMDQLAGGGDREIEGLGVTRTIGKHDPIGVMSQNLAGRGAGRYHPNTKTMRREE